MKLQEALDFVNEEAGGEEELKGKEDRGRLAADIKKKLIIKGFTPEQAASVIGSLIQQLNSSGWLNKILPDDERIADIKINIDGSQVRFFVTSDENPKETQTFTINSVGEQEAVTPQTMPQIKQEHNGKIMPLGGYANKPKV